ncbi:hypothetical protein CVT24_012750 [Panaeolus cyanescens]|uniref:Uncharacterized protein n=1 Tax=Panaeolus cyanescens TaxID=181874 RepID=A0A409YJN0_9AGAR|nr:hypothetical protein CVT24_012750 [Panaeolus cyanescens]
MWHIPSKALQLILILFVFGNQAAAMLWDLDLPADAKRKVPEYEKKLKEYDETRLMVHNQIREMSLYITTDKQSQKADFLVELGGASNLKSAKLAIERMARKRIRVMQLYGGSSEVKESDHPDNVFIHSPPEYAAQHKYFARLNDRGVMFIYDGFFAITNLEERAKHFIYGLFRAYTPDIKDCQDASPHCAMAYAKLSDRLFKEAKTPPQAQKGETGLKSAALAEAGSHETQQLAQSHMRTSQGQTGDHNQSKPPLQQSNTWPGTGLRRGGTPRRSRSPPRHASDIIN